MRFGRKENICFISEGVDRIGRPLVKIEQAQVSYTGSHTLFLMRETGKHTADPVKQYPSLVEAIPDDKALADAGWFHPTKDCERMLDNYNLQNMYQPDGERRSCFRFDDLSIDAGRQQHTLAALEESKEGNVTLICSKAVKKMAANPEVQAAATKLAKEGVEKPDGLTLGVAAINMKHAKELAIAEYPGGREAVIEECNLRGFMRNQKLYKNSGTPEAIRAKGVKLLQELYELHDKDMNGPKGASEQDFARTIAEMGQSEESLRI